MSPSRNSLQLSNLSSNRMLRALPLLLLFSYSCRAADVCLAWSPSDSPGVIGYKLYVDTSSMMGRSPAQSENVYRIETVLGADEVFLCVEKLLPGFTYYFRVTCFVDPADSRYTDEESDFSNEVSEVIPIIDWTAPVFIGVSCSVNETTATISWTNRRTF